MRFKEIEHKFIVGEDFDLQDFRAKVQELCPVETTSLEVRDVYYLIEHQANYIYRHRYDHERQHLTVKSIGGDSEVRVEINLDLGQHRGDQQETVEAFLETGEIAWRGVVQKQIEVYYFSECEIVYYAAATDSESVKCVEFEAIGQASIEDALASLSRFEKLTGFAGRMRTKESLVEILYPEIATHFEQDTPS